MKVLVAYMSTTGNTKKVAEAIYQGLDCDKEIMPVDQVTDLSGYDLSFLGFPVVKFGADPKAVRFLQQHCCAGRNVALFITHAAPEGEEGVSVYLDKFRAAAAGANVVATFDCQGQLATGVKRVMLLVPFGGLRAMAKRDNSQGQPDASRLARARAFGHDTLAETLQRAGGQAASR